MFCNFVEDHWPTYVYLKSFRNEIWMICSIWRWCCEKKSSYMKYFGISKYCKRYERKEMIPWRISLPQLLPLVDGALSSVLFQLPNWEDLQLCVSRWRANFHSPLFSQHFFFFFTHSLLCWESVNVENLTKYALRKRLYETSRFCTWYARRCPLECGFQTNWTDALGELGDRHRDKINIIKRHSSKAF